MKTGNVYKVFMLRMVTSTRSLLILGLIIGYSFVFSYPMQQIARSMNTTLTPVVMPLLINDQSSHLVLLSGLLFALVLLDFQRELRQVLLVRAGYISYAIGYLCYIITITILYEVSMLLVCQLWLLPVTIWKSDWGDGWRILSKGISLYRYHVTFIPNAYLIENYSASEAMVISVGYECLLMIALALFSNTINTLTRSVGGTFMSMIVILSDMIIYNMFPISFRKFSPVTLAMLSSFMAAEQHIGMTQAFAASYYAIMLLILIACYFLVYVSWLKKNTGGILV